MNITLLVHLLFISLSSEANNQPGGGLTIERRDRSSFGQIAPAASRRFRDEFFRGRRVFHSSWKLPTQSREEFSGLGPLFNANSCGFCHRNDGRGRPHLEKEIEVDGIRGFEAHPSLVIALSIPSDGIFEEPDPVYGFQLQPMGHGVHEGISFPGEGRVLVQYSEEEFVYPDGKKKTLRRPKFHIVALNYGPLHEEVILSPRLAPAVFGLGLLEAISSQDILQRADPEDKDGDGISGKPSVAWDYTFQRTSLGRFGWRAASPDLRQQNAAAAVNDMSLMNRVFQFETITKIQAKRGRIPTAADLQSPFELSDDQLSRLTFYTHLLAVPRQDRSGENFRRGKEVFAEIGCNHCHVPEWQTDLRYEGVELLMDQKIEPYTDLLLHDMGEDLADQDLQGRARSAEWRTPPLWGLGLHGEVNGNAFFLHDGRARDVEEAILWHGGEAETSKRKFIHLSSQKRAKLIYFLERL